MSAMDSTTAPQQGAFTDHGTTISAAALQAQLLHAQKDNTRLISRIVELEVQRDNLIARVRHALAMGLPGHATAYLRSALGDELTTPPPHCWNCGLPLVGAHIRDETIIVKGDRRASVHRACAEHLASQGWELLLIARDLKAEA